MQRSKLANSSVQSTEQGFGLSDNSLASGLGQNTTFGELSSPTSAVLTAAVIIRL